MLLLFLLQILFIPLFSPMAIGFIRKIKARMQNREGASVVQPYFDLIKLFRKDEVVSYDASWIFRFSSYFIFTISVLIPLGIPILSTMQTLPFLSDFLVIVYLIALMTFFLALSGIDVGSSFGGFGSSREMTLTAITEGAFVTSLLSPVLVANTNNLIAAATMLRTVPLSQNLPLILSFLSFLVVLLAEAKRFPFDNPATHLELTMIHEAMILEYSGKKLALIEWAGYNKLLFFTVLGVNIFFPWSLSTTLSFSLLFMSAVWLSLKIILVLCFIAFIESLIAKYRFFRLPDILLTSLIFAVISLIAITI